MFWGIVLFAFLPVCVATGSSPFPFSSGKPYVKATFFSEARDIIAPGGDVTDGWPVTDSVANSEHESQLSL